MTDVFQHRLQSAIAAARPLVSGRVTGAVLYGDVADGPWYFDLIREGAQVAALRDRLLFGRRFCEPQAA